MSFPVGVAPRTLACPPWLTTFDFGVTVHSPLLTIPIAPIGFHPMIIRQVRVRHFRSLYDASLGCDRLTALVGRNGAGKSSFLRALEMFYDPAAKATDEDHYDGDTSEAVQIAIKFGDLPPEALDLFSAYVDDDTLTVVRVFSASSKTAPYHGMRMQNPAFSDVRHAPKAAETLKEYRELRSTGEYSSLPAVRSTGDVHAALAVCETENPKTCERMKDDGQFFGFTGGTQGYLGRFTRFIRIPAVLDAADEATDKRGSYLKEIMDLVVRNSLAGDPDVDQLRHSIQEQYNAVFDPSKRRELNSLEAQLSETLRRYAPDTAISVMWSDLSSITIPMPETEVRLSEDGYDAPVQQTGHGLQRAFILTMLQHLVAARADVGPGDADGSRTARSPLSSLVLAIDEPELYQHPGRQRHMASILLRLANGSIAGVAQSTQVIYTTHGPLFVGLDRFDQIRMLRKTTREPGEPKATSVVENPLQNVADRLWVLHDTPASAFTPETLRPRLQAIMTPWMNEGFFADVVVLVEGETDRAAILAVAHSKGQDLEAMGVCVIPCMGKNNMDRPALVFRGFDIPTYLVWDNDRGAKDARPAANRHLLRVVEGPEVDWPSGVWDAYACLDENLESIISKELTEDLFQDLLERHGSELGMTSTRQGRKNALVLRKVIDDATSMGRAPTTLGKIVDRIVAMRDRGTVPT